MHSARGALEIAVRIGQRPVPAQSNARREENVVLCEEKGESLALVYKELDRDFESVRTIETEQLEGALECPVQR